MSERNLFPEIIRFALRALANEERQVIVTALLRAGRPLTLSELAGVTGLGSDALSHHLRELERGNIIEKMAAGGELLYRLSGFGVRFVESVLMAVVATV